VRVLVVDDEPAARARLRRLLTSFPDITIVGEAPDGERALERCARLMPDAVFLDVQMPGISGLDLASSLPDPAPAVVFVSAHDRYAVDAFDTAAVDYLLKPVELGRLTRAVERLRLAAGGSGAVPVPAQLLILERGRTLVIAVSDILWLEAADNYVIVHTDQSAPLMRRTLAGLVRDLGPRVMRIHRSVAVALGHVRGVQARGRGDSLVSLTNGASVPCSRQYREQLLEGLGRLRAGSA
jgi:two-component system, LytTR family, response regulator